MSIRHLDALFRPGSVAVIGASDRPHSAGGVLIRNLLARRVHREGDAGEPEARLRGGRRGLP